MGVNDGEMLIIIGTSASHYLSHRPSHGVLCYVDASSRVTMVDPPPSPPPPQSQLQAGDACWYMHRGRRFCHLTRNAEPPRRASPPPPKQ